MEWSVIVALLALVQFYYFGIRVAKARQNTGIKAPAMTGAEELERAIRIHYNTMEQLVIFLPALWAFSTFVSPLLGAALGLIYLAGRFIYAGAYMQDPSTRGLGFGLTSLAVMALMLGGVGGAAWQLFRQG